MPLRRTPPRRSPRNQIAEVYESSMLVNVSEPSVPTEPFVSSEYSGMSSTSTPTITTNASTATSSAPIHGPSTTSAAPLLPSTALQPSFVAGSEQNGEGSNNSTANSAAMPPMIQSEVANLQGQIQAMQIQLMEALRVVSTSLSANTASTVIPSISAHPPSPMQPTNSANSNNRQNVSLNLPPFIGQRESAQTPPMIEAQPFNPPQQSERSYALSSLPHVMKKIYDLPEFGGAPEDWPMFHSSFEHSTVVYQYSNFENCLRLQKALKGEAKEAVKSLLIHPDNVFTAMEQFKFQYGRPDLLIRSQLRQLREIACISESCVEKLVPFSVKVQNFSAFVRTAGGNEHLTNPSLMDELVNKLLMSKRLEWAQYALNLGRLPTIVDFASWLQGVANLIRSIQTTSRSTDTKKSTVLHASNRQAKPSECPKCGSQHKIFDCKEFIALDVSNRWNEAKRLKLCFSCLKGGHSSRNCRNKKPCAIKSCQRNHNKLLHETEKANCSVNTPNAEPMLMCQYSADAALEPSNSVDTALNQTNAVEAVLNCVSDRNENTNLLFRVLPVVLYGPKSCIQTYALLDEGSSVTMIEKTLVRQLELQGRASKLNLSWYGGKSSQETAVVVDLFVSGVKKIRKFALKNVYGVPNLKLPVQSFSADSIKNCNIPFGSYRNVVPRLLIGLDHCHLGLPNEVVALQKGGAYAANTPLGWVVFGNMSGVSQNQICLMTVQPNENLNDLVADYFETENFGVKASPVIESNEIVRARKVLKDSTTRIAGRYQSRLLWCEDDVVLPDNYSMALNRLLGIERKMKRDPDFAAAYKLIIDEYEAKGYARKILPSEKGNVSPITWYLPHFAVSNPNKPGKIRLVFDAAATVEGVSLNSKLLKGPQEQKPLLSVLFNFRVGPVGVCADIKEMFHQVLVAPEDRCAQRFLWRDSEPRSPDIFEMRVMTFGAACSPCIAQYVKDRNAVEYRDRYPRAVESILEHHYVDDFVDSFETPSKAIEVAKQVRTIHEAAGYELRHFTSNSADVVLALEGEKSKKVSFSSDTQKFQQTEKILGLYWNPGDDAFKYNLNFHRVKSGIIDGTKYPTKRELLRVVMSIFDPMGFLCHFMISAKMLLREVWRSNILWDDALPAHLNEKWDIWRRGLQNVSGVSVPRHYFEGIQPQALELHTFVDASEEAFAAVAYWRWLYNDGCVGVSLVAAKTRTAPMKTMTIPRLELQAAVLGTRLMRAVLKEHTLKVDRLVCWSDSTTVIGWIASESRRYKPFVAHRIAEILDSTRPADWKWLPTCDNVADEATRMRTNIDLSPGTRWFKGPQFLRNEKLWPENPNLQSDESCLEELGPKFTLLVGKSDIFNFNRFSSFLKLKRTMAWVLRVGRRLKERCNCNGLTADELKYAEKVVCRLAQQESFGPELKTLAKGHSLPSDSELISLLPYIDEDRLLRVYGRIDAASWLPLESRHPIILSPNHPLSSLVVSNAHNAMKHQNFEAAIGEIRRKFWIMRLRKLLKRCISNCNFCKLNRAKAKQPLMGSLPADRLTPFVRPFSYTGLDYFGPVNVTVGRRREKRWVALFVCMTIRAIHLEATFDLSTDACILALRNFINRRGTPIKIRSDNGKNFVGVDQEAKRFDEVFDAPRIQDELTKSGVQWEFNCPHNPAEGGAWERMVQSVKKVLRVTLKEIAPRDYTLQSLLIEAENLVNSRPLTYLPVSHEDEEPITPNHFLLGSASTAQTPACVDMEKPTVLKKQWRISRQLRDHFWKRWIIEYLPTLTRRSKWCEYTRPLAPGDLVLICDPQVSRREWRRGVIERVYEGADKVIRRADVRTNSGILRRPVSKLAVIDIGGES